MKTRLLMLLWLVPACSRSAAPMPGDSVSPSGVVTLSPPPPVVAPTMAAAPAELGAIESQLFPAELVMEKQAELGLSAAQVSSIAKHAREGQAAMLDLQWKLQAEKERLVAELGAEPINETTATRRAAELMTYETRIKAAHLTMLVRIKNALTPAQRATLQASREPNRCAAIDAGAR